MSVRDLTEPALASVSDATGIDLTVLPAIAQASQVAPVLGTTEAALAQDRYRRCGIPYVKYGRRVRYLRADIARYLMAHRNGGDDAA